MKTLFLIRHAKSSWAEPGLHDFDRPLNKRGHRDAPVMAQRLIDKDLIFDQILSSPANRAKTTAQYFAAAMELTEAQLQFNKDIYEAWESNLVEIIQGVGSEVNRLALFGHNPTFTTFANKLCGASILNVPTCGIVAIDFNIDDWSKLYHAPGKLRFFDFPKNEE